MLVYAHIGCKSNVSARMKLYAAREHVQSQAVSDTRPHTEARTPLYPAALYQEVKTKFVGLARTIHIRLLYGIFGRVITKYTVIYGVYIRTVLANPKSLPSPGLPLPDLCVQDTVLRF